MFEGLIEVGRRAESGRRSATFGVALCLHLCALAAIVIAGDSKMLPIHEPPIQVTFLRFAPLPMASEVEPGPGTAPAAAPAPGPATSIRPVEPLAETAPALPQTKEPVLSAPSPEVVQPQATPEEVFTEPFAEPQAAGGAGVKAGVEGGVPGGIEGGVPGGVEGGVIGGVPGGNALPPVVIQRVQPDYPPRARNARVEGVVKLEAVIRADGTVGDIKVLQGLRMGCTEAAIEALRRWRFRPGKRNGVPVDVPFTLTVDFILG